MRCWKVTIQCIRDLSKQIIFDHFHSRSKGHTDSRVKCRLATLVALLIELKAQIL